MVILVAGVLLAEAIAAVDRTIATGLEGHLGGDAAAIANHVIHLALAAVVVPAVGTAAGATARLVLEAFFSVELLFRSGEGEFGAAFAASKGFVGVHSMYLLIYSPNRDDSQLFPWVRRHLLMRKPGGTPDTGLGT